MIVYFACKIEVDLHCCQELVYCCEVKITNSRKPQHFDLDTSALNTTAIHRLVVNETI